MHRLPPHATLMLVVALVVAAAGLFALPTRSLHAQEPVVRVSPVSQTVSAGNNVVVNLMVSGAPTFGAYEFHLAFDKNVLGFVSITNADTFLQSTGRQAFCVGPDAGHLEDGIVSYACGSTGVQTGPSGSGTLATVTFSTFCAATTDLGFVPILGDGSRVEPVSLSTVLGNAIATDSEDGGATVTGPQECTFGLPGDASCDGAVNAIDAAIVLQFGASLLRSLDCEENADVNEDGRVDAIDAALILQFVAGLIHNLPP